MESLEPVFTFLRVAAALAAVVLLIWFVGRRLNRRVAGLARGRIRSVARHGLGPRQSVQVMDIDQTRYVLGVAEHSVSVLDTYPVPEDELVENTTSSGDFSDHLRRQQEGPADPVQGSVLSPQTWRQAARALRRDPSP